MIVFKLRKNVILFREFSPIIILLQYRMKTKLKVFGYDSLITISDSLKQGPNGPTLCKPVLTLRK